jgi:hypothetical protein
MYALHEPTKSQLPVLLYAAFYKHYNGTRQRMKEKILKKEK